jgi:hypothetical protein
MATLLEEEEYEFSECAELALRIYYPDTLKFTAPYFNRSMIELQLALIRCHKPIMSPSDRRRAVDTVKQLKFKLTDPNFK